MELKKEIREEINASRTKVAKLESEQAILYSTFWCWELVVSDYCDNLQFSSKAKADAFAKRLNAQNVSSKLRKATCEAVRMMEYIDEDEEELFASIMKEVNKKRRQIKVEVIKKNGINRANIVECLGHGKFPALYEQTSPKFGMTIQGAFNEADFKKLKAKYSDICSIKTLTMDSDHYCDQYGLEVSEYGHNYSIEKINKINK